MKNQRSVLTELDSGVFSIRLNRPSAHNAFNGEVIEELLGALEEAARLKGARVLLLSGEGKSFCAGADIDWMRQLGEASLAENERSALRMASLFERLDTLELPLVARVGGAAIGGGVGLVAVSDIAVASARATFSLSETRLGLVPAVISPYVLRKIGPSHARDLMLTGRRIDAGEALRMGLVHRVVEETRIEEAVQEVLRDLKSGGPEALGRVKRLLRDLPFLLQGKPDALARHTAREIAAARSSEEGKAGTRAFLEKKPAPWGEKP